MVRGHQHQQQGQSNSMARSFLLRTLSLGALLLPVIFYILSLSFSLKTLYEPNFALSAVFDQNNDPYPPDDPYTYKAGPFYDCVDNVGGSQLEDLTQGFNQTCTRISTLGAPSFNSCMAVHPDYDEHFCQRSTTTALLLVSGSIFIGVALLLSIPVALAGFSAAVASTSNYGYSSAPSEGDEEGRKEGSYSKSHQGASFMQDFAALLATMTTLLASLAAILILAGQALGINAYIDNQLPSGIDSTPIVGGTSGITQSPWYWGPGAIIWPSIAWLSAVIGAFIATSGCGVRGR